MIYLSLILLRLYIMQNKTLYVVYVHLYDYSEKK